MQDESINILLFLANGFEDLEASAIRDIFGWTQYRKNIKKAFRFDNRLSSCYQKSFRLESRTGYTLFRSES
jgi:hypothetical protein